MRISLSLILIAGLWGCAEPTQPAAMAPPGGGGGTGGVAGSCPDRDGDGYQDKFCNPDPRRSGGDCADGDGDVNPGRSEDCRTPNVDSNCDGVLPNRDPVCDGQGGAGGSAGGGPCMDADGDGYQDATCNPDPRRNGGDCDDEDRRANPGRSEICGNSVDDDCNGGDAPCLSNCTDNDLDGFGRGAGCRGRDCDDRDPKVNPWQSEICGDGIDQDCDGEDLGCPPNCIDRDNDGFGACPNGDDGPCGCYDEDCDDTNPEINPGARDVPGDRIDQDCDGYVLRLAENCRDIDEDGYGDGLGCEADDCDDTNPRIHRDRVEICGNGIDDDCRGGDRPCVNRGEGACQDQDGDGFGLGACPNGELDCDEGDRNINPNAPETCNGVDDNCNDIIDECPLANQVCEGGSCVGGLGSPCRQDGDCSNEGDLHCSPEAGQCRVRVRGLCNQNEDCDPTAECADIVCDDEQTRCYQYKGGACENACDCTGRWLCHAQNEVCVECLGSGSCNEDARDQCTDGGFCVEAGEVGVINDARIDMLNLVINCWNNWSQSNEAHGCYTLTLDPELLVGGNNIDRLGPADDDSFERWVCDRDGGGAAFGGNDYDVLREVFGCGLVDLFNIFWRDHLNPGSTDEWCMYYAPDKAGFGFPDDTRAAVVVARCSASSFR